MKTTTKTRKTKLVAEVCLYGNRETGAGWLARTAEGAMLGTGDPKAARSFTDAVWLACDAVRRLRSMAGHAHAHTGTVRVFAPGGERMADTDLNRPATYGDLHWVPATMLVIDADAIIAAAESR